MRSRLILLVFLIPASAFCGDQTSARSDRNSAQPYAILAQNAGEAPNIFVLPRSPQQLVVRQSPEDDLCYTMHSIIVARERDSDATQVVRQRTCTPSNRFRSKKAIIKK
jgi:hypothetical protein